MRFQVANKKCAEMEGLLVVEQTKSFALDAKVKDLEQQLYSCTIEMDAVGTKYGNMINVRDEEIKKLKVLQFNGAACLILHKKYFRLSWSRRGHLLGMIVLMILSNA